MRARLGSLALMLALAGCQHLPDWMGGTPVEKPKLPGERYAVLPAQTLPVDPQASAITVTVPAAAMNTQWPQHMGTPRASIGNLKTAENLSEKQSASVGEGGGWDEPLVVSPVIGNNTVFAMDAIGAVSAHDASDIAKTRWVSRALVNEDEEETLGGGLAFDSGMVFAVSGRGIVVALAADTGKELWRKSLGAPLRSAPKVDSGKLFVVSVDNQIFALDYGSGVIVWSGRGIDETASYLNAVSPGAAYGVVVAPYSSGMLQVLRADDGGEVWSESLLVPKRTSATSIFSGIGADPVIQDGVMYAVGSGGMMAAYQLATGQRIWEQPISSINTPWLAGDFLYVLTADNTLVCLQRGEGRVKWARTLPSFANEEKREDALTWTGPVMVNGQLLVTGAHGEMMVLAAADGSVRESKPIPEGVYAAPVVAQGNLYLISRGAVLYRFN